MGHDSQSATGQLLSGSCACGQVRYRVMGPLTEMVHCHCPDCRKRHGAAFATHVGVAREQFSIVQGQDVMQSYRTGSGTRRWFCRCCGSKLVSEADDWSDAYVTAGTLDSRVEAPPQMHIFVRSKVGWYDIRDGHPQHATYPIEWGKPAPRDRAF